MGQVVTWRLKTTKKIYLWNSVCGCLVDLKQKWTVELKCKLNSSQMLHWRTSSQVWQRGIICQHCSAQTKITSYFQQSYSVTSYGTSCMPRSQNCFTEKLNTAPMVKGAWFLNALYPLCLLREMWDSESTSSTCFVPGLCLLQYTADLALWLWWCGMSWFGLLAEFHRGFLNKVTESDLLPSIFCSLTSGNKLQF